MTKQQSHVSSKLEIKSGKRTRKFLPVGIEKLSRLGLVPYKGVALNGGTNAEIQLYWTLVYINVMFYFLMFLLPIDFAAHHIFRNPSL